MTDMTLIIGFKYCPNYGSGLSLRVELITLNRI